MGNALSIILPAFNEGVRLRETLDALRRTIDLPYEVIVVNDASTDGCCDNLAEEKLTLLHQPTRQGVASARNLGAARSMAPVLIAMDAHCIPCPGWLDRLLRELDKPEVGIAAPQIRSITNPFACTFGLTIRDHELGVDWLHRRADHPYPVPIAGCACLAMRRDVFESIGCFDEMRAYGMEDVELCLRCWLLGYSVVMVPDAVVGHWFKSEPFQAGWHDYLYNRLRTAVIHFDDDRLRRIVATLQTKPQFAEAAASLLMSDVWERRGFVRARRQRHADWFCGHFSIPL